MDSVQQWGDDLGEVFLSLLRVGFHVAVERAGIQYAETRGHDPSDEEAQAAIERVEAAYKAAIAQRQEEIITAFMGGDHKRLASTITAAAQEAAQAVHLHS